MKHQVVALCALATLWPSLAAAQSPQNPQQNANTFRPGAMAGAVLGVDGARAAASGSFSAGVWFGWSHLPLKVTDAPSSAQVALVRQQVTADVVASYGLLDWLALGVGVPVFLRAAGDAPPAELQLSQVGGTSLGDVRLSLRAALLDAGAEPGLSLAVAEEVSLPTATRQDFSGDAGTTAATRLLAGYQVAGLQLHAQLGVRLRRSVKVLDQAFGNELLYAAAASYPVVCGRLDSQASVSGWTAAGGAFGDAQHTVADAMLGGRLHLGDFAVAAAAGGGLAGGAGSPAFRATLGLAYAPPQPGDCGYVPVPAGWAGHCPGHPDVRDPAACRDGDGDGVLDRDDACPLAVGASATAGCPDGDGDGVADGQDRCPRHPGTAAVQGCPDQDGDGVGDDIDDCPQVRGSAAARGCADQDGDGVPDAADKCPTVRGAPAAAGCPLDRDGDGVADADDQCPDAPGPVARRGCPADRVTVTKERVHLAEKVYFDTAQATIAKKSLDLLGEVATVLKAHPEVRVVRIEGHTDNAGSAAENLALSERRAQAVKKYLESKGIAAKRLRAIGMGDRNPVADNADEAGRAANRRVELHVEGDAPVAPH